MEEIINPNIFRQISINRVLDENSLMYYQIIFPKFNVYIMNIFMITGPLITYIFQILKFYKTKSSKGFSKYICLFLFLGNALRIFFWYGTRFSKILLYQSIGIVIFQIILIHLCIKFREESLNDSKLEIQELKNNNEKQFKIQSKNNINIIKNFIVAYFSKAFKPKYFKWLSLSNIFNLKIFWNWEKEKEYYRFMILIILLLSSLCYFFKNNKNFFHIIGIISAFFEGIICFPQVVSNFRTKMIKNISFTMISCWLLGDSFKLFYFIKYKSPLQLIICISAQVFFDLIVIIQLIFYRNNDSKEKNIVNSNKKQIEEINQLMKSIDELNIGK